MRTGAPFEKARITPAAPTPAPISALPEITAWIVSPAPCVPVFSSTRPCFLKMPASCPSVGAWFSQLLICPMTTLSVSSADAAPAPSMRGMATAAMPTMFLMLFMRFLLQIFMLLSLPYWPAFNTGTALRESLICQRRRRLAALLAATLGLARVLVFAVLTFAVLASPRPDGAGAAAEPPALATRIDQYSHERVSPVVFALICPA